MQIAASLTVLMLFASMLQIFRPSTLSVKAAGTPPAMGINLIGVGDTNTDFLFADMIKEGFRLQPPPNSSTTPALDANGWPTGDFSAFLWDGGFNPPANKINGTYALRFTGKAHVGARFAFGTVSPQNSDGTTGTYDASTNTTTATVVYTADTMALEFTNTQRTASSATNTGVTNIQLMRPVSPGASTSYSFNTTFTTDIKTLVSKFQAIRFMDYSATNGNTDVNWADRQSPVGPSQGKGAWEYAIQLCNETGRDAYINVPALATDDYVTQLAQLFKYGSDANGNVYTSPQANPVHAPLNSNLHLYIEYSNEVWNGMFASFNQNYNAAQAEVAAGNSPLNYDGETNTYVWGWRRIGLRIKQISDIFRSVFGDSAMPPNANAHIRPLLEWQYGNAQGTAQEPLQLLDDYFGNADGKQHVSNPHPVNYFLWGGGGAAYTGVNNANASTIDDMYNSGFGDGTVNPSTGSVKTDVQWARAYGLHDVAYEGGFQIGGDYANSLQKQANVDPRAQQLQVQTQTEFNQDGGDLLMYFDSTSPNYGLAVPTVFDQNTPKMQAINQLNQSTQVAATNGTQLPNTVNINSGSFVAGNRVDELVLSPVDATYGATLNLQTNVSASTLQILVNNTVVQTLTVPQNSQANSNVTLNSIALPAGLNAISIRGFGATDTALYSLSLTNSSLTPVPTTPTPTPIPTPIQQANIANAATAPVIDGNATDAAWSSATSYPLKNAIGTPSGFSASYQASWDNANLYFLIKVQDTSYSSHADGLEIYIDPTHSSGTHYTAQDMQYVFSSDSTTVTQYNAGQQGTNTAGIVLANGTLAGGYEAEIKIPWSTLGVTPKSGKIIGLDLAAKQNTTTGNNKLFWNATADTDWTNPSYFGLGTLQGQAGSGSLPAPWQQQDIGSVGQTGSASASNGTFTVTGSGNDIWDTADAFQYVSQPLSGDGTIVARIDSQQNTDGWAKAGVMIRESLTAGSTHALMALTPDNGAVFQRRTTTGGSSSSTAGASVAAPYWVKLQRAGSTFTGSISSDGSSWTVVGSDTISMATNAYVGLAVTAHNTSALNTTSFSQVSVTGGGATSNLSQNKPATASSSENSGVGPGYAVDGDPSTRWSSLYSDPQWLQVDLGASHRISEVKLQWETAYGKAYQIQVSADGSNWTTIYTQSNGSGGTEDLKGLSGTGRYVRMYGTQRGTSWGYSLYEFQVFGV
ncbi:hypothetical protein KDK_59630 [Dictyobacter kobayashii]|uniref:F5/8 type C domain-containing protein n=1 Tax=Dictyobacter kobayashii TaxID=2014872 RepID=A0A402ASZ0_9CHLR|nr:hypothetical protein KDK_59630 [Dictyobacter kobayashii]